MSIGPVEYIIVGFEGNEFNGRIVPELNALVESGQIRILDLVFISKDAEGDLVAFEYDELDELAGLGDATNESMGLLNDEDIEMAAEVLEPNTSAAFLVFEDLWAAPFAAGRPRVRRHADRRRADPAPDRGRGDRPERRRRRALSIAAVDGSRTTTPARRSTP